MVEIEALARGPGGARGRAVNDHRFIERLRAVDLIGRSGRVRRILPTAIEADGPSLPLGALCSVEAKSSMGRRMSASILAEVVGVDETAITLAPFERGASTFSGARVVACQEPDVVPIGDGFLGRAVDALARPIDGLGDVRADQYAALNGVATTPLERTSPRRVLGTGIRAIDGLLTLGEGQRVGVFAASGVGKTTLMTQLASGAATDCCVVCLVGERGREVEALWSEGLSAETRARTALVAATSDQPAAMRVRAAHFALTLAEHWRGQGRHVLLVLDSVTRLAMAMREIGLAAGEPPTVRAYTPSVFAALPRLVERCGALKSGGAITAVITVLAETDDVDDPISELMKSLLDGHLILSRELAEQGHFPAIDAPRSVSRGAETLVSEGHQADAQEALNLLSAYEGARTLIETGVYAAGANRDIDRAVERRPALMTFLRQGRNEFASFEAIRGALATSLGGGH
ncbi:MAG: FliI/YscN family ATPase [Caulobacterales bacterium]